MQAERTEPEYHRINTEDRPVSFLLFFLDIFLNGLLDGLLKRFLGDRDLLQINIERIELGLSGKTLPVVFQSLPGGLLL